MNLEFIAINRYFLTKMEIEAGVLQNIVKLRLEGLTDEKIHEKCEELFPDQLNFGLCRNIDKFLSKTQHGGYWRCAYDFPETGETVRRPKNSVLCGFDDDTSDVIGYVTECGFFTCNIDWQV